MERIRVVVADDSAFMRKIITDILHSDKRIQVVATARDGMDALNKVKKFSPDVITMDLQMPAMDGLEALEAIMRSNPIPVIIISGETEDVKNKTIEAMSKGAVDFIVKPSGQISLNMEDIKIEVIDKVKAAASINDKVIRDDYKIKQMLSTIRKQEKSHLYKNTVIAIGTSTGGPRALEKVLSDLPKDFMIPIFVVQHMPRGFTRSLADRLNLKCDIHVKEAEDNEKVEPKTVYIAPGDQHLTVEKRNQSLYIRLTMDPPRNGHRPSVDVLIESITDINEVNKIAVILTGMGNDGTKGVSLLKAANENAILIAESRETAVIYGMPKSVIMKNKADFILPIQEIGKKLVNLEQIFTGNKKENNYDE